MSYNYTPQSSIVIPLKNSTEDEIIEIDFSSLPEGDEILQILRDEHALLHFWIDLALEYYRSGHIDDFIKILTCCGSDAGHDYPEYEKDQVRALDMLAAYYVMQGHNEKSEAKRRDWFTKATLLYTTADKMYMHDQNHLLGRATFCLIEGSKMDPGPFQNPNQARKAKMDQAKAQFDFVINQPPSETEGNNYRVIPALMGKACIAFDEGRYKDALLYLKKCIRLNPNCPADVRVGMGHCFARLGRAEKARVAFERALELCPSNIPAVIALGVLDLNTLTPEGVRSGIQSLGMAYQSEPENPMVLNHLANHFFCRNDLEKTEQLAFHAITIADNDFMKAESFYHLARCYHKKGNLSDASRFYYQSTTLAHPKFILPQFGLGQIYISQCEYEKAITSFEKVLKVFPHNYESLSALGSLYANIKSNDPKVSMEMREKAREYLKKCLEISQDDVEVIVEYAQLQEKQDPQASLNLYLRVAEILEREGIEVPPEILNNAGCLYFALGQMEDAKKYFQSARDCIFSDGVENLTDESTALIITITYNLGRVNEQLSLIDEAEKQYRQIIRQRPNYIDCILRLGCLVRDKGDTHNASLLFKESMQGNPNNADPWTLIGNMHMTKSEWGPAQKKFEQILKMHNGQNDAYSLIALGNIWLEILFSSRTKEKDEINRQRALGMFTKALKLRPQNIWAANGIGCVLAHKGCVLDARDIFSQVRESIAEFPDVWINIAHIYMEQRQYNSALQMYRNCMGKFNKFTDVQLLIYIARAFWKAEKYIDCRDYLEKALIEAPDNIVIRFNHAVVLQKIATAVLQEEKATSREVLSAIEDIKTAEKTFIYISHMPDNEIVRYKYVSRSVCANEAGSCSDLLKQAVVYLQRAQAKDDEEHRQRQYQEEQRRLLFAQRKEEETRRQAEKNQRRELLELKRREYIEKTKEILRMPEIKDEKKIRIPTRKRREEAPDFINNDSSESNKEYEYDDRRRRREKSRKRRRDESASSKESSEDENQLRRRDDPRRRDERMEDDMLPARLRNKVKSKAFVSSSSSSSDNEQGSSGSEQVEQFDDDQVSETEKIVSDSEQQGIKKAAAIESDDEANQALDSDKDQNSVDEGDSNAGDEDVNKLVQSSPEHNSDENDD